MVRRRPSEAGIARTLFVVTAAFIGFGLGAAALSRAHLADVLFAAATCAGIVPAAAWVLESLRRRRVGGDVVALLALLGTLATGEYLAGAVVALMLASGRVLEARATRRAERRLAELRERVPRLAHRIVDGRLHDVPAEELRVGDVIAVSPGEIVPADARAIGNALVDESALSGESLPTDLAAGDVARSGAVNAGEAFEALVLRPAGESTYAGLVELVVEAQASAGRARLVRVADRWAGAFLLVAVATALVAWLVSGDLERAVAVLVIATPCPLILAAPIAITSGLSRAAASGALVKGGQHLEGLAAARVVLLDKTGTLTAGRPQLTAVANLSTVDDDELVRLAASLDQLSAHVLARAVVAAAADRGLTLALPTALNERPGQGIAGDVGNRHVALGKAAWVAPDRDDTWARPLRHRADLDGSLSVFVALDGVPAGALLFDDPIRPEAARTIRNLRSRGIEHVVLVSGDRRDVADSVGVLLGIDEVLAERTPADKLDDVARWQAVGSTVMVGDGINDAPALARADVGVAMAAGGGSAAAEAADVALLTDRFDRLDTTIGIAQRSRQIARQSVALGMGLSIVGMGFAAAGALTALAGAIAQEAIDLAAIACALRALGAGRGELHVGAADHALSSRFSAEHDRLRPMLAALRRAADNLDREPTAAALDDVDAVHRFLADELAPHELREGAELYPVVDRVLGAAAATQTMARAHTEIVHQIRRLGRLLDGIDRQHPDAADIIELRRALYGLHAILELHFDQEDEAYLSLLDEQPASTRSR